MALIAHQAQVFYPNLSSRSNPWTKGIKLRSYVAFQLVDKTDRFIPLKHRFCLRGRPITSPRGRPFKVLSFKGNAQNDKSDCSKFTKAPIQLAHAQEEKEEITTESPDVQNHRTSYASGDREDHIAGSLAIQKLFRKWLLLLRTQTSSATVNGVLSEEAAQSETSESQKVRVRNEAGSFLKAATVYFLRLDAAISLPLLVFIPFYLAVRVMYGAEVTKELTPLWVLGPLIFSLYIKIVQVLCSLYMFCFMSAIGVVRNLPSYSLSIYNFVGEGKLGAYLYARFWKPIVDVKNMDYMEFLRWKMKQVEEWAVEKYLDYVESIWPYYCRTIRFLKKANLI